MSEENKAFEQGPYKKTAQSNSDLIKEFPTYKEVMDSFAVGENSVELRKRFLLKKLDETWINAIEDCIPSLDQIIRHPQFRLEEKEEVLPVEISKHINGRSVQHLSMHTENIQDILPDGSVVPTKLLNVFQEDTVLTYENRFINTLVNRLYAFVAIRYNGARDCGEDEKNTKLTISQDFAHQEYTGKIKLEVEIGQKPDENEVIKNYVYTSDLWKRMEKIMEVINEYMQTPFITNMGKNFIHPPVLRTNTIMKNPLFKDCLSLWEFIETYQTTGYEALVQEDLLTASDKLIEDMYNSIAEQYVLFQAHIENGFDDEKALNSRLLNINPLIKDTFDEFNENEFNYKTLIPGILKNEGPIDAPSEDIELAIIVALAADAMMWEDEIDEEISEIDDFGNIKYRYKFSIIARLIKAQLPTQDYYNEVRNELLAYTGVKSLLSWSRDLYKLGRKPVAKLNVKGKTLFVYLPLDPKEFDQSHYHHLDVSKEDKEVDYPFLLKVRSPRACKYAKELIAKVMAGYEVSKNEKYKARDYHLPEMSLQEMLDLDLARPLDKNGPWSFDWNLKKDGFKYKYIYSFQAKVIRSGEERQEFYNEIKNYLLSYNKVKSSLSWPRELFRYGRNKVCQLKVKGKTLCVYLPLNPDKYDAEHFHHEDVRVEGKDNDFMLMLRVKSNLAVKHAKELIDVVMSELGVAKVENYERVDYKFAFKTLEEMLAEDLARLVDQKAPEKPAVVEEEKKEDVITQVDEDTVVKNGIMYKYIYSYSARLIRSGDDRQYLYNLMKNEVLSYKKVNSKISWGHELFKLGRIKCCEFRVKGKTLCVYLPLNPDNYDQEHYHFIDNRVEGKEVEFPMIMKVKSERAVKYTAELLKDVMALNGIVKLDDYVAQDYKLPYMSIDEMLVSDPVLAKLVENKGVAFETKPVEEEPVIEEVKPEVVEEVKPEPVISDEDEEGINFKYKFSFSARLIRSGMERQDFYNEIKNELLSYKKVNSKISWSHEFFKLGRKKCALLKVKGKTLCVYLPLDPDKYDQDRLYFQDLREEGKEVEFPMLMKVKSDRAVKYVKELIADVMSNLEIEKNESYEPSNFRMKEISLEKMLSMDPPLAKLIENDINPFVKNEEVLTEPVIEEQPRVEEPEVQEQVIEEPIVEEKPTVEETPVIDEEPAVEEQPMVEESPIEEEVISEEPEIAEEPAAEEAPVIEEPVVEETPLVEEPAVIEEPIMEETPVVEEPIVEEQPKVEEPVAPVIVEEYDEEPIEEVEEVVNEYDDDYLEPGFNAPVIGEKVDFESYNNDSYQEVKQSVNTDDDKNLLSRLMRVKK